MVVFERSKWLHAGRIYLELLLYFALESCLLMCVVEMVPFKRGDRERAQSFAIISWTQASLSVLHFRHTAHVLYNMDDKEPP